MYKTKNPYTEKIEKIKGPNKMVEIDKNVETICENNAGFYRINRFLKIFTYIKYVQNIHIILSLNYTTIALL